MSEPERLLLQCRQDPRWASEEIARLRKMLSERHERDKFS